MYVLGYNSDKKLTQLNQAVKQNLKTYLGEYRMITDAVNIIDGFIVNIGIDFEVACYQNYNKREVVANCLVELQDYFNIDNWTFNKPINISEIELILANKNVGTLVVTETVTSNTLSSTVTTFAGVSAETSQVVVGLKFKFIPNTGVGTTTTTNLTIIGNESGGSITIPVTVTV